MPASSSPPGLPGNSPGHLLLFFFVHAYRATSSLTPQDIQIWAKERSTRRALTERMRSLRKDEAGHTTVEGSESARSPPRLTCTSCDENNNYEF